MKQFLASDSAKRFLISKRAIIASLVAILIVGIKTAYFLHSGYNIADESYLWYGMQRILHGEVPQRDFLAYDPGRYYWGALFMFLGRSDGIIVFRIANAVFEAIGLGFALALLATHLDKKDWLFFLFAALSLSLWFFPSFKSYDEAASVALIFSLALLVEKPTVRRYFFAGIVLGLVSTIGRNHTA